MVIVHGYRIYINNNVWHICISISPRSVEATREILLKGRLVLQLEI
jgi:hypothetical protein